MGCEKLVPCHMRCSCGAHCISDCLCGRCCVRKCRCDTCKNSLPCKRICNCGDCCGVTCYYKKCGNEQIPKFYQNGNNHMNMNNYSHASKIQNLTAGGGMNKTHNNMIHNNNHFS